MLKPLDNGPNLISMRTETVRNGSQRANQDALCQESRYQILAFVAAAGLPLSVRNFHGGWEVGLIGSSAIPSRIVVPHS